jgi:hypothetical protein
MSDFRQLAFWAAVCMTVVSAITRIVYAKSRKLEDFLMIENYLGKVRIYRVFKKLKNPCRLFKKTGHRFATGSEILEEGVSVAKLTIYYENICLEPDMRVALVKESGKPVTLKQSPRSAIVPS